MSERGRAVLFFVMLAGCGGGGETSRVFTPAAARAIFARCTADAKPFVTEQAHVQLGAFHGQAAFNRHQAHAYAGIGRAQSAAADALGGLGPARPAQAGRLRAYLHQLRAIAEAQRKAASLIAGGDFGAAYQVVREADRPLILLTYHIPNDLLRLGGLRCLAPEAAGA